MHSMIGSGSKLTPNAKLGGYTHNDAWQASGVNSGIADIEGYRYSEDTVHSPYANPSPSSTPPSTSFAPSLTRADDFDFYESESDKRPVISKGSLASSVTPSAISEPMSIPSAPLHPHQLCPHAVPMEKITGFRCPSKARSSSAPTKRKGSNDQPSQGRATKRRNAILSEDEVEGGKGNGNGGDEEEDAEEVYAKIKESHEAMQSEQKKGHSEKADDCWTVFKPVYEMSKDGKKKRTSAICHICHEKGINSYWQFDELAQVYHV
ncbi:hypothetical protein M422DRAFT_43170 [Sphaerobolus stellatus SS14]|nr:hypothetical protein M422DRAFT_43170 [Sphaerobolus stellatus SS14]